MVKNAEWVAGITLNDDDRKALAARLTFFYQGIDTLRKTEVGYEIPPAIHFTPIPGESSSKGSRGQVAPNQSPAARYQAGK